MGDIFVGLRARTPQFRLDFGLLLIFAGLAISIPRWTGAFFPVDGTLITGAGMGVLLEGGAAYLVATWRKHRAAKYANALWLFFALDLILAPAIQTPHVVAIVAGRPLAQLLALPSAEYPLALWAWAALVTAAPVALVAGVALGIAISIQRPAQAREDAPHLSQVQIIAPQVPMLKEPEPGTYIASCTRCNWTGEYGTSRAMHNAQAAHGKVHKTT